jgi:uncharacterized sulfatase
MICRTGVRAAALAALMLVAPCGTQAGQELAGREKLRAQSDEFRRDVIRLTDGVYVAVGHPDHTGGAAVFAGHDNPDIYSHQLLDAGPPDIARGMRDGGDQFGMTLPDSLHQRRHPILCC